MKKTIYQVSLLFVPLSKYLSDQIRENEEGGACSTYRGDEKCIQGFDGESEGNNHVEALGIDGRMWTGLIWLRLGQGAGSCEHGNQPWGFHKV